MTNLMMVLTSDHAVAPTPEFAKEQGFDGQRLAESNFVHELKMELSEHFGPGKYFLSEALFAGNLFLNHPMLERKGIKLADVTRVVRDFALASGKFQAVYSREQLLDGRAPGPLGELVLNGYHHERSGDLVLIAKPYYVPGTGKTGTTHGSPYSYDTHIPIMFYGHQFKKGRFADPFAITDIVPTLCTILKITEPAGCVGKPFVKIIETHEN